VQVTLLKQEKVAALADSDAALAMAAAYRVATKPHGHGDVHFLLHSSGTARRWHERGTRWLMFFQASGMA
jgi:UDP-sugar pyrophosphorylase